MKNIVLFIIALLCMSPTVLTGITDGSSYDATGQGVQEYSVQMQAKAPAGTIAPKPAPIEPIKPRNLSLTGRRLADLSDEEFSVLKASVNQQVAEMLENEREAQLEAKKNEKPLTKQEIDRIKSGQALTADFSKRIMDIRESLSGRRAAYDIQRQAILRGTTGPFSMAHFLSFIGLSELAGADAAQIVIGHGG